MPVVLDVLEVDVVDVALVACVMVAVLAGIEFDVVVLAPELADAGVVGVVVVVDVAVVHGCVSALSLIHISEPTRPY